MDARGPVSSIEEDRRWGRLGRDDQRRGGGRHARQLVVLHTSTGDRLQRQGGNSQRRNGMTCRSDRRRGGGPGAGRCPMAACGVVGRTLASDGASLGEALDGLQQDLRGPGTRPRTSTTVQAFSVAWSDATLDFLQDVSCEDPLTGLASLAHLRSRLTEIYRNAERTTTVYVRPPRPRRGRRRSSGPSSQAPPEGPPRRHQFVLPGGVDPLRAADRPFTRALRLASVADGVRAPCSTVGRPSRGWARTRWSPWSDGRHDLGKVVATLRSMLNDLGVPADTRIWIEGLPGHPDSGRTARRASLLSDLAHTHHELAPTRRSAFPAL